ncbi:MAG: DUF1858 domain-containing protein [Acholeplasmataceae bacterium]|nr:DUF1858 domain-containing protein [Acholeplasmataceae bacterium]
MQKISLNTPIYQLIKEYPEIKDIMLALGFENITNPVMLQTAGRVMSIKSGAKMKKIDLDMIKKKFQENGFDLEDIDE